MVRYHILGIPRDTLGFCLGYARRKISGTEPILRKMVRLARGSQPEKTCDARIIHHFPIFLLDILRDAPNTS